MILLLRDICIHTLKCLLLWGRPSVSLSLGAKDQELIVRRSYVYAMYACIYTCMCMLCMHVYIHVCVCIYCISGQEIIIRISFVERQMTGEIFNLQRYITSRNVIV